MRKEIAVAATVVALGGGASLYQYLSQGRQVVYQLRHDFCANTNVPLSYSRAAPSMLGACQLPTSLAASACAAQHMFASLQGSKDGEREFAKLHQDVGQVKKLEVSLRAETQDLQERSRCLQSVAAVHIVMAMENREAEEFSL